MTDATREIKKQLRCDMLTKRRSLPTAWVTAQSEVIAATFSTWPIYLSAATVMFYLSMPDEPQTEQIILDALGRGKKVCVPLLGKTFGEMAAAWITDLDSLMTGRLGLKMPDPERSCIVAPADIDLIVVPGVAFDSRGNRLGMGAGYYDRFLEQKERCTLLGLAWSCQNIDKVPSEPHDIRMHYLLTEKGLLSY